jgi:outer membrane receptor protein involved in Fe transport
MARMPACSSSHSIQEIDMHPPLRAETACLASEPPPNEARNGIRSTGTCMRRARRPIAHLTVIAAALAASWADAAETVELPAVTVSVGRGSSIEDMDVSTSVIPSDEIRRAPQTSTEQIVNRIPGVFALQQPAGQLHPTAQVFSIRGFGTTTNVNTLLLVDGVPLNDPYFRTIDWGQIPKESIERIEVIRGGGATSLWGNLAMGGIVNVVTREPQPGERRFAVSYGSHDSLSGDAAITLLASDRLRLGLDVGTAHSDGYDQTPSQYRNPAMGATRSEANNVQLTSIFTPSAASRYYLKASAHESQERGLVWNNTKNEWSNLRLVGGGSTRFDDASSINVSGWLGKAEMDTRNAGQNPAYSNLAPSLAVPYVSQIEAAKYRSGGGSVFYQTRLGAIKDVKLGFDLRRIEADDALDLYGPTAQTAAIAARGTHRFQGVFAQGTYRPASVPLDVTLGLREDFWQARGASVRGRILATGSTLDDAVADASYSRFDPRLGAKYYFDGGLALRGAVYRNFAAPGMNQMYRSFVSGTTYTATSPDLKPQTNRGREIGVDFVRGGLDAAFTLFDNRLDDFIDFAPLCTTAASCDPLIAGTGLAAGSVTRVSQYVNAGSAVFRGAELLLKIQAGPSLRLDAGVTRTDAYLTRSSYTTPAATPPAPVRKQIGQIPRWMATLGATWLASAQWTWVAQLKAFPDYWNNTAHTQRNDGAVLLDLGASYRLSRHLELWASVQNLGDRRYYDQGLTYTTIEGSTVSTGSIPALGLPRILSAGMRAAF